MFAKRIRALRPVLLVCLLLTLAALVSAGWPTPAHDSPAFRVTAPALPAANATRHLDGLLRRLELDGDDELQFTASLAVALEHFVESAGAGAITTGRDRLTLLLHKNLPTSAAANLDAVLAQYLDYHERIAGLDDADLERLTRLQHRVFGPERAQALFGQQMELRRMMQESLDDDNL